MVEPAPALIELDVSYQSWRPSGITTYTIALAEELAADPRVELELCHRGGGVRPEYPAARNRRLGRLDSFRVPPGRVRLVPHQLRLPVLRGATVVTIHDVIYAGRWTPPHQRIAFAGLLEAFRRRRVGVLADSHSTRSRLLSLGFEARLVEVCQPQLPKAMRQRRDLPVPTCGGGGSLYLGNLRPHKDVDTLLTAHLRLGGGSRLHLVTSSTAEEVARLLAPYPAEHRRLVCVHHQANDEERNALLQHALVVVCPSLEEGYGYAIDEALAQGTPVIASCIPPHIELAAGRDVELFPPGDVRALVPLLARRLAGDGAAWQSMPSPLRQRTDLVTALGRLAAAQAIE